ncbi:MAG: hypothetical protein JNL08_16805 [Planctomycetes bacterium]|nr:hypothetical protein [Planctomycetota bacterium]
MSEPAQPRRRQAPVPSAVRLLPTSLLQLRCERLALPTATAQKLAQRGITDLEQLLRVPASAFGKRGWCTADDAEAIRHALATVVRDGTAADEAAAEAFAFRGLQDELFGGLQPDERALVVDLVGFAAPPRSRIEAARRLGVSPQTFDDRAERARAHLHQTAPALLGRLRYELGRDLDAAGGLAPADRTTTGTLAEQLARGSGDALLPARLATFCFPLELALHRDHLCATGTRTLRRLLRALPRIVQPHRLPLSLATVERELASDQVEVPRNLVAHALRTELRLELGHGDDGEPTIVPDPRGLAARLVDLMLDLGGPTQLDDLVYAYRDRFRRASRRRIAQRLHQNPMFLQLGPATWSLRRWHKDELAAVEPLVDRVARRVAAGQGRQSVAALLAGEPVDVRTLHLVLDRLAVDPRVRLLGRGEVCPASHQQSGVLAQLLTDFRRAGSDVVTSLFVQNQPPERRRLVERLLRHNRLFVQVAADRIDVLSNYPFNAERLRRLLNLVGHHLEQQGGRLSIRAAKQVFDGTDLGGGWLSPLLLADLLRRHGPYEVLGDDVVCRRELRLGAELLRTVRQALREAQVPLTVDEILQARPELAEFAGCLHQLVATDPLLQTPDGNRFTLV